MPCYCSDIKKINQDITTLGEMLSELNSLAAKDSAQTSKLLSLSSATQELATPANKACTADAISRVHRAVAEKTSEAKIAVERDLTALKTTLTSLKKQDELHHDQSNAL